MWGMNFMGCIGDGFTEPIYRYCPVKGCKFKTADPLVKKCPIHNERLVSKSKKEEIEGRKIEEDRRR